MFRSTAITLALCIATMTAQASLQGRTPLTPGGTDYQAYYDDLLNITWLANANLAATNTFGALGILTGLEAGQMPWDVAQSWIAAMNTAGYLGKSDWRLPTVTDTDGPDLDALGNDGCDFAFTGTDCGWNVDLTTGEMADMFSGTLSNVPGYDTSAVIQPCYTASPNYCLTDPGPFLNLQLYYWYGTEYAPDNLLVWGFSLATGSQYVPAKNNTFYAWPVRDGDFDSDGDGAVDSVDNCTLVANTEAGTVPNSPGVLKSQLDSDQDGYGNACDGDLNNSSLTTAQDNTILRNVLNQNYNASATAAKSDLNGSGLVTAQDNTILRNRLNTAPGPSGLACAGTIPCP